MPCEYFSKCKKVKALKRFSDSTEGLFLPTELFKEICQSDNPATHSQCPVVKEINEYGHSNLVK